MHELTWLNKDLTEQRTTIPIINKVDMDLSKANQGYGNQGCDMTSSQVLILSYAKNSSTDILIPNNNTPFEITCWTIHLNISRSNTD